ncbi:MAG: c-type cytochrome [Bacteroidetes bacterium]|nr:c-type cytochrome [Bacteroidota bacterium]
MFRYVSILLLGSLLLVSCAESGNSKASGSVDVTQDPAYKKGFALVKQSDCLTCHQVDAKGIGPSYKAIAQKYAGSTDAQLYAVSKKIIKGGAGVWGQIPMTPHPTLSSEDAQAMLQYILLLK